MFRQAQHDSITFLFDILDSPGRNKAILPLNFLNHLKSNLLKIGSTFFGQFQDLLFPPICLHCQSILHAHSNELSICSSCDQKLALMPPGFSQTNIMDRVDRCWIDHIYVAYQFESVIQSIIHAIKYSKRTRLGIKTGKHSAEILKPHLEQTEEKIFIPVPLHPNRQKERGYNQSLFIAKGIIQSTGGTILKHCLMRSKNTVSQTSLNREERQRNIDCAFHVRNAKDISGKTILMVDDLITTGATINECARVLKESGAKSVIGIAVASPVIFQPNPSAV